MDFTSQDLVEAVRAVMRRAVERGNKLNVGDTAAVRDPQTDDLKLARLLMKMRKRDMLHPSDLSELRVAFRESRGVSQFRKLVAAAIAETEMDREMRKNTPR